MSEEIINIPRESTMREVADALNMIAVAQLGQVSNAESWQFIQQLIRQGLGPKLFPVGTQLQVNHSAYGTRLYDVVAHDYLKSVRDENAHTMTIMQHDLLSGVQFDAQEAFYYAENELAAGTYSFTINANYSSWEAGTYQFVLTESVPQGGQLTISGQANTALSTLQVRSYASRTASTAIESVAIVLGSDGINLGSFGVELNHAHRVSYGSNNYKESAIRQFLNSSAAAGSVWTPQTKFDRPPSWQASLAGFAGGLDQDFIAVVGKVVLPCSANNTYEAPDSTTTKNTAYTLNDEFYIASRAEVFGSHDVNDGSALFSFYEGAGNADRIKYRDDSATHWWLRTPFSGDARGVRRVDLNGTLVINSASNDYNLAPACTIM